ncbi:MAG: alpha-1,4-glucan--maltose-1-phosphate maltosyltransferase [Thiogranum sp.]|nr:alpha-1,4-glucan--maltose-1-phosphate maltosyltransferase [Thiogranum sp.]
MSADISDGRQRAVIENLTPNVDAGRFPVKRSLGEQLVAEASVFADGHDHLGAVLQYRHADTGDWQETPMQPLGNDRWRGAFGVDRIGTWHYTVSAWVDDFSTWRYELSRREQADDIALALLSGADLLEQAASRAAGEQRDRLSGWAAALRADTALEERTALALSDAVASSMARYPDRRLATRYFREYQVVVDRERARFSTWYELFPRSCIPGSDTHGNFDACKSRLAEIAAMGFDIIYLPPIHPIGHTNRKGRNNTLIAEPGDPGSPWAIGSKAGGHKAVHPDLGSLESFREFVDSARGLGMEVALDIAFQCSPDHPYVNEHPQWFRRRPDGSVQYAENPPKKYQDIYPIYFETDDWKALWEELKSVFEFWIEQGVLVFRVDNPHTKPFAFWEWLIGEIRQQHPEVLFLAEAFARPSIMYRLAKLGFTQSYTYFTWRNTRWEISHYLSELTRTEVREFFRPNFWPNTPDILHEYLQFGSRPAFMARLVLASTLAANYGIYGPAYELLEREPREFGSEEYLNSEKYEVRRWDTGRAESLKDFISRVNHIRRDHPALQQDLNLEFYPVDNEQIICYGKWDDDRTDIIIGLVNLDPYHRQSGWVELPLETLDIDSHHPYQMHDLLTGARYLWNGARNYVELDPQGAQAHIFHLLRRVRTERDFEYFF